MIVNYILFATGVIFLLSAVVNVYFNVAERKRFPLTYRDGMYIVLAGLSFGIVYLKDAVPNGTSLIVGSMMLVVALGSATSIRRVNGRYSKLDIACVALLVINGGWILWNGLTAV